MVQATTMTAVMAEKDPPVFRDFLGIGRKDDTAVRQPQPSAAVARRNSGGTEDDGDGEVSTKAASGTSGRFETCSTPGLIPPFSTAFPTSSDPGTGFVEGWLRAKGGPGALQHHGVRSAFYKPEAESKSVKRRDSPIGRESLQERLQMSVEALENSRPQKVARVENKDDKVVKIRSSVPTVDELRLSMQPPRVRGKGLPLLPTASTKPELTTRMSKKPDRPRPNIGGSAPARLSHLGVSSDRATSSVGREHDVQPAIAPPAADEGSNTGIKGSPLGGLLSAAQPTQATAGVSSGPASHVTPRRLKVSCHSAGSDSLLSVRHQFAAPPSRQLTIFYGGQAHVFDEVPPDKANQIMELAGSNGRSWSTTYSPRQTTSIANSASEESLSALERERGKNVNLNHGGSGQNGGTLALSTEVQTLLRGLAQSGSGSGGGSAVHGHALPDTSVSPLTSEIQLQQALTDRIVANGLKKDNTNGRSATRPTSCTEDINTKEAFLQGGQRWM